MLNQNNQTFENLKKREDFEINFQNTIITPNKNFINTKNWYYNNIKRVTKRETVQIAQIDIDSQFRIIKVIDKQNIENLILKLKKLLI